ARRTSRTQLFLNVGTFEAQNPRRLGTGRGESSPRAAGTVRERPSPHARLARVLTSYAVEPTILQALGTAGWRGARWQRARRSARAAAHPGRSDRLCACHG